MNFFNSKKRCNTNRSFRFTEIMGLMIAVIGAIIIVQILPIRIWLFILGLLLVVLGCTLFKLI